MATGLGGMVQRGLGDKRFMMDMRRAATLSGSVDGTSEKVNILIHVLEMGQRNMAAVTSQVGATVHANSLLDGPVCALGLLLGGLVRSLGF
jgi:hypothetical protein